jgi:hypothetical protein
VGLPDIEQHGDDGQYERDQFKRRRREIKQGNRIVHRMGKVSPALLYCSRLSNWGARIIPANARRGKRRKNYF